MKSLLFLKKLLLFIMLIDLTSAAIAQDTTSNKWNEKTAAKWLRKNEWKNGLDLKVHPSLNKISFAQQYHKNKAEWDKTFAFLRDNDLADLKPGTYKIDGDNVYAIITEAPSKEFDKSAWESHRKYIDLHYIIRGKELIGIADASKASITKPYSFDATNYEADGTFYEAGPDTFFLMFPNDAHKANIKAEGYDVVKKLVIKIQVAE